MSYPRKKKNAGEATPHRLLFSGELVSVQLVGLDRQRGLRAYSPPEPVLLVVTAGKLHLAGMEATDDLAPGTSRVLSPIHSYDLATDSFADLLLITGITMPDFGKLQEPRRSHARKTLECVSCS